MRKLAIAKRPEYDATGSGYAQVAAEYYDAARHPTCANFRDASALYLRAALRSAPSEGVVVDVGAGRSLAAEILVEEDNPIDALILLDSSTEMLQHSSHYFRNGTSAIVGDACALPFADDSVSLIVSSLGDPYNVRAFWDEVARCLRPGGRCLFTAPSYDWAKLFRSSSTYERRGFAFFELMDNRSVYVPSIVHSKREQAALIDRAGLTVVDSTSIDADRVPAPHSRKLPSKGGIVTGYTVIK